MGPRDYKWNAEKLRKKIKEWIDEDVDFASVEEFLENISAVGLSPDASEVELRALPSSADFSHTTERDIESALVSQLDSLLGLKLFVDEDGRSGKQYDAGEFGRIDLIATDSSNNFVVIELKREATREAIGQLAGYKAFVEEKIAQPKGRSVVSWILARRSNDSDEDTVLEKSAKAAGFAVKWYKLQLAID